MVTFLRRRRETVERAWYSDKFTAREKGHALFVLGDAVVLARHPYDRDPSSGSGNCWCGRDEASSLHQVVLSE